MQPKKETPARGKAGHITRRALLVAGGALTTLYAAPPFAGAAAAGSTAGSTEPGPRAAGRWPAPSRPSTRVGPIDGPPGQPGRGRFGPFGG